MQSVGMLYYYYVHVNDSNCITVGKVEKFQYIVACYKWCTQYSLKQQLVHSNNALHFIVVYRYEWRFCFRFQFINQVCARAHRTSNISCIIYWRWTYSRSQWRCSLLKWLKERLFSFLFAWNAYEKWITNQKVRNNKKFIFESVRT